jgi:hypothetical protein
MKLTDLQEAKYYGDPPPILKKFVEELYDEDKDEYELPLTEEYDPQQVIDFITSILGQPDESDVYKTEAHVLWYQRYNENTDKNEVNVEFHRKPHVSVIYSWIEEQLTEARLQEARYALPKYIRIIHKLLDEHVVNDRRFKRAEYPEICKQLINEFGQPDYEKKEELVWYVEKHFHGFVFRLSVIDFPEWDKVELQTHYG